MNHNLSQINKDVYKICGLKISNFTLELESKEYHACQFELSGRNVVCRCAKITPKKVGQFVTFWKRSGQGPIEPFHESDAIDFFLVNVRSENNFGQFVFPKSMLIEKGILSSDNKEGKRAFRVYPSWDITKSTQAAKTQNWQLDFFYELIPPVDLKKVIALYQGR